MEGSLILITLLTPAYGGSLITGRRILSCILMHLVVLRPAGLERRSQLCTAWAPTTTYARLWQVSGIGVISYEARGFYGCPESCLAASCNFSMLFHHSEALLFRLLLPAVGIFTDVDDCSAFTTLVDSAVSLSFGATQHDFRRGRTLLSIKAPVDVTRSLRDGEGRAVVLQGVSGPVARGHGKVEGPFGVCLLGGLTAPY